MSAIKRWDKSISGALVGMFLVGCSLLSVQRSPADQDLPRGPRPAGQSLQPGVTQLTVERVGRDGATIAWKSSWEGRSQVLYGKSPVLLPTEADHSPATADRHMRLAALQPGTRYFFQVETQTPLGVVRSAVLSFRTR